MMNQEQESITIQDIVEKTLNYLEKSNPEDVLVFGGDTVNSQIRFTKNEIIVGKRWASKGLSVFYVKDKKIASTFLSDITSMDTVYKSLDELIVFGKALPPKEDYQGIAKGPFSYSPIANVYDPKIRDFSQYAVDRVEEGLNAAIEYGGKHSAGILEWGHEYGYFLSNHGVEAEETQSSFEYLIRSFIEPTESGQGMSVGRTLDTLNTKQAGETAGEIAKKSVGGKVAKGGVYNALLSPTVVADIIARTVSNANPFSIEIGQSWLKDKIGEKISTDQLNASDDATIPNGLGSRICDAEGVPSQKTPIIEQGVLKNLIHNTSTAKKADAQTTSNAGLVSPQNSNIVIETGTYSFDEMIQECRKPTIYVTSNWYTRTTSAAEGIFSTIPRDGMFLIENGEIKEPIRELRISDSFPNLVNNIYGIQKKNRQIKWWVEVTTPTFAPAMLIKDVTFSSGTR